MSIKNKKLVLSIFIILPVIISCVIAYFLFLYKCPYEIGTNIIEWIKQPCPYIIQGVIIDRISGEIVNDVVVSCGKGDVRSSAYGEFIIKFRGEMDKIILNKEGYHTEEIKILLSKENKEINLGKISLEPERRVIGIVIEWLSERPLNEVNLIFSKGGVYSSGQGEFVIKTSNEINREDIDKLVIKKDGYQKQEVVVSIGENEREVNLGKIILVPEGKVIYQIDNNIFNANLDGSEIKKLTEGELVAITPTYDRFLFKNPDSAMRLMDVKDNNQTKFPYQPLRLNGGPTFTTFSLDGNILAWIGSYEVEGPQGKRIDEEVFYFNFEFERLKSVSQIFRNIYNFRISPNGKYIAVAGISYDGSHMAHLEDMVRHKPLLQVKNIEKYFFDKENFYYSIPSSGWYIYHLQDGKTDFLDLEPIWWENKFVGKINPYTEKDIAILRPGWSIRLADINGLNVKKIVELEPPNGYVKNLRWSSNKNYLLFEISKPYSLWVLDINNGKYKKIADL